MSSYELSSYELSVGPDLLKTHNSKLITHTQNSNAARKILHMSEHTWWETIKVEGHQLVDKVREIIAQGNVRRIVVKHEDRTIAEFPLAIGVVGAVFAPILAAVGAIAALVNDCKIEVERVEKK